MAAQTEFDTAHFHKTFTHETARVNGVRLHYVTGGTDKPLLLVHGFGNTWYGWRYVMPALAQRYTVMAPDLRGLGDSERPLSGYDKITMSEDLYALLEHLGHRQAFVAAFDFGVPIAYMLAARHPEVVQRLALLDTPLPGTGFEGVLDLRTNARYWFASFHMVPDLPELLIQGHEREYLQALIREFLYDPTTLTEEALDEYTRTYSQPGAMRAACNLYRTLKQDVADFREPLQRKLPMPLLALAGSAGMGQMAVEAHRNIANQFEGHVVERCGHFMAEERPEEITRYLMDFFQ